MTNVFNENYERQMKVEKEKRRAKSYYDKKDIKSLFLVPSLE